jgi:hypothetical protein
MQRKHFGSESVVAGRGNRMHTTRTMGETADMYDYVMDAGLEVDQRHVWRAAGASKAAAAGAAAAVAAQAAAAGPGVAGLGGAPS